MKVDSAVWEGGYLKLHTADVDARHFAYAFTPGEYEIKPKKSLRSLDANALAWFLIDKLAAATGVPKTEVYRNAVRDVGGNSEIVCVKAEAAPQLRKIWESRGLGWQTEEDISKLPGCVNVILYYGSSTFDTRQMSRMIDNLIQDARSVGIETMAPEKLAPGDDEKKIAILNQSIQRGWQGVFPLKDEPEAPKKTAPTRMPHGDDLERLQRILANIENKPNEEERP